MNREQFNKASALILAEPFLCEGSLAIPVRDLKGSDLAFYQEHLEGNVKVQVPQDFNCAMGALAEGIEIPLDDLLNEGNLSELWGEDGNTLYSSLVQDEFGLDEGEQNIVMSVNDASPVERRKGNVVKFLEHLTSEHERGAAPDPEELAEWASETFGVEISA